mgnify:CR=1 FL=1
MNTKHKMDQHAHTRGETHITASIFLITKFVTALFREHGLYYLQKKVYHNCHVPYFEG